MPRILVRAIYIHLLLATLCGSSEVVGRTVSAKLSLETFEANPVQTTSPTFGSYYVEASIFKGDYQKATGEIESLVKARQDYVEKAKLQERSEIAGLKEEHKTLMWSAGNQGYDVQDKTTAEFSKWSVAMYSNISRQALLKQGTNSKIAAWDTKNYLKVESREKSGKKYIVSLQVVREKKRGTHKAVASIP